MATIEKKISELTAKTTALQPLDLIEVSEWNGATYDTKSISGGSLGGSQLKYTLTAAQIKTGSSVPVVILNHNTAGTAIEVISASWRFNWATVQFDASFGTDMRLVIDTAGNGQFTMPSIIDSTTTRFSRFNGVSGVGGMVAAKSLVWDCGDDSTVGDSTIDLYINYRIITL